MTDTKEAEIKELKEAGIKYAKWKRESGRRC
jgi:hypothetical protein